MASRRQDSRIRVELEVAVEEGGSHVFRPSVDLSPSGILVASDRPPEVGTPVRVVMSLPPRGLFVRLQGEVVRHCPTAPGFAVRFLAVDEDTAVALRSFVSVSAEA